MHPVYTYGPTAELWSDDYEVSGHYGTVSKLRLFFSANALAFARRVADTESLDGDLAGGVRIRYGSGVARSAIGGCSTSCVDCWESSAIGGCVSSNGCCSSSLIGYWTGAVIRGTPAVLSAGTITSLTRGGSWSIGGAFIELDVPGVSLNSLSSDVLMILFRAGRLVSVWIDAHRLRL